MHFLLRTRQLRGPHRWNPNRTLSTTPMDQTNPANLYTTVTVPLAFALRQHPLPSPTTSSPTNAHGRQEPAAPHSHSSGSSGPSRSQRKKRVCPEGTRVRSLVEAKEREVGLRCDDLSCMCGPEDGAEDDVATAPALPLASLSSAAERVYLHKARLAPERWRMTEEADGVRVRESACAHARMRSMPSAWSSAHAAMTLASGRARTSGHAPALVAPLRVRTSRLRLRLRELVVAREV